MSRLKQLIHEIHRRSLWQVLLIYCGAALVAYQAVQALTEGLGLPQWFPAFAIVLFIVGLPIVLATAFVHEVAPPTVTPAEPTALTEAEAARIEAEAVAAHHEARRRHRFLTWRNSVATFVIVLAAWGVVATGWLLLGDRGAAAEEEAVARKSLAVLPLDNLSPDPENAFFAAGIHDDILSQLAKIGDLTVISRQSVLQYADTELPMPQIAAELNVDAILEGSVRRVGDHVRVVAQLIDGQTDAHLWSDTYDRELTVANVFEIQSEIAQQISNALQAEFTPEEKRRISSPPTADLEAYDYYLRGLEFMWAFEERNMRIAAEMLETATQLDTSFALAYARLSQVHSSIYFQYYDRSQERLGRAKDAVDRSLELEPDLPEAHEALGYYYYRGHLDYERAMQEFETALNRQPNNADLLEGMAYVERRRGDFQTAVSHLQKAAELDPRDAMKLFSLAQIQSQLRYYPEADRVYERVLALAPDMMIAYALRALNYVSWDGNLSRARAVLEEAVDRGFDSVDDPFLGYALVLLEIAEGHYEAALARLSAGSSAAFSTEGYYIPKAMLAANTYRLLDEPELARQHLDSAVALLEAGIQEAPEDSRLYGALGLAYARLGRVEDAIRAGEKGVDLLPVSVEAMGGVSRIGELAQILTMTGQHDAAIDRLEYLLSVPGFMSVAWLRSNPQWDPLRDHPRFQALLAKYE